MKPSPLAEAAGLLLAGGRSRRFGAEKAVAQFRGRALMDCVAERLGQCALIAVSARPESAAAQLAGERGWPVLHDEPRFPQGPLSGVFAGLQWTKRNGLECLATAPCDAPLLPAGLFETLLGALGEAAAAYVTTDEGEHVLCAVWRTRLLAPLGAELGSRSHPPVRDFLRRHGAMTVHFNDEAAFANANTLASLHALEGDA